MDNSDAINAEEFNQKLIKLKEAQLRSKSTPSSPITTPPSPSPSLPLLSQSTPTSCDGSPRPLSVRFVARSSSMGANSSGVYTTEFSRAKSKLIMHNKPCLSRSRSNSAEDVATTTVPYSPMSVRRLTATYKTRRRSVSDFRQTSKVPSPQTPAEKHTTSLPPNTSKNLHSREEEKRTKTLEAVPSMTSSEEMCLELLLSTFPNILPEVGYWILAAFDWNIPGVCIYLKVRGWKVK